jgi:AhpD family alkylhydroperoxidase
MPHSYKELTQDLTQTLGKMHKEMPDVMQAFGGLSKAATADGALDKKSKELIALALAVANHCQGCIGFHTAALVKYGVTRDEFMETLKMAIYMGGGPSLMYAAEAFDAYEEFTA